MTEPEAWREIARRIVEWEWGEYHMYSLVFAIAPAITAVTKETMENRVTLHLCLATLPVDGNHEARALAALWLALEAEDDA